MTDQTNFAPQYGATKEEIEEMKARRESVGRRLKPKVDLTLPPRSWAQVRAAIAGACSLSEWYYKQEPKYPIQELLMEFICLGEGRTLDDDNLWLLYRCAGVVHLANYGKKPASTYGALLAALRWIDNRKEEQV